MIETLINSIFKTEIIFAFLLGNQNLESVCKHYNLPCNVLTNCVEIDVQSTHGNDICFDKIELREYHYENTVTFSCQSDALIAKIQKIKSEFNDAVLIFSEVDTRNFKYYFKHDNMVISISCREDKLTLSCLLPRVVGSKSRITTPKGSISNFVSWIEPVPEHTPYSPENLAMINKRLEPSYRFGEWVRENKLKRNRESILAREDFITYDFDYVIDYDNINYQRYEIEVRTVYIDKNNITLNEEAKQCKGKVVMLEGILVKDETGTDFILEKIIYE